MENHDRVYHKTLEIFAPEGAPEFPPECLEFGMWLRRRWEQHLHVMAEKCVEHSITECIIKPWKSLHQKERRNFRQNVSNSECG